MSKIRAPKTLDQAAKHLAMLGRRQRQAQRLADRIDAQVARCRDEGNDKLRPVLERMLDLFLGLKNFAEAHRDELTEQREKKTVRLATGDLSWRNTPPKLEIDDAEQALKQILKMKIEEFVRRPPPEIDKDALKKNPDAARAIAGVRITQVEEFRAKPEAATAELTARAIGDALTKAS